MGEGVGGDGNSVLEMLSLKCVPEIIKWGTQKIVG